MTQSIKKNLFKQFIQERCHAHIEAVQSNVLNKVITVSEAQSLIDATTLAYSIEQQFNYAKATGGIKIGQALFIGNEDLKFVTSDYLKQVINEVIANRDIKPLLPEFEAVEQHRPHNTKEAHR